MLIKCASCEKTYKRASAGYGSVGQTLCKRNFTYTDMLQLLLLSLVTCQVLNGVTSQKLPDTFPRCKQEDPNINDCIKTATNAVIPQLKDGIPSLGVPSLDPLKASKLEIDQGQGPIALKMTFTNVVVKGLSECKVSNPEIDLKKYSMLFHGDMEKVTLDADYEMSGRVLLLPVTGKGRCRLSVSHLKGLLDLKGQGLTKKNKNHFDITKTTLDLNSIEKLESHFDNLFNGDKTLGDSMNTLLNENWKELWDFLKPAFDEAFGAILHQYSRIIFNKVPFNDIFLE